MKIVRVVMLPLVILGLLTSSGCDKFGGGTTEKLEFKTPYQVVFVDNNNAYIGKLQQIGKDYIRLDNVFYIQSSVNPDTKQVSNALTKRGNELHKPDFMIINTHHIIMIEPVTSDSQVAKLIEQSETQKK
jgi:hypothetical protein